jgi:KaiC/GvpD/RAD55 family RecA-like ATPase
MYRKEVNAQSPLRILEKSIHGGLGTGNLGVVMSRAGVGKTACLVQIGLDDLMQEKKVLHIALEQSVEHVLSWYEALFEDLVIQTDLEDSEGVHTMITKNRMITAFADHDLWPARLEKTISTMKEHLDFRPAAIVVDGYPWEKHSVAENAAMIGALKTYASFCDAELWMSAQTHRQDEHPAGVPAPCADLEQLIEVALFLEPHGDSIAVRLLKDHDDQTPSPTRLTLHPDALRLELAGKVKPPRMPNSAFTLLSGGARGAEAEFGVCAEKWGLAELNFSFAGRKAERNRGLVTLTPEELGQGAVSAIYVEAHMHRTYPDTPLFKKTLQTIWHQVNTAGEVFAVGVILEDHTVKGGTGWAVELARHWGKPVFVFDQERHDWFTWTDGAWVAIKDPTFTSRRFAGTGTRYLSDEGRAAIHGLFERSLGPAPSR